MSSKGEVIDEIITNTISVKLAQGDRAAVAPRAAALLRDGSILFTTPLFAHAFLAGAVKKLVYMRVDRDLSARDTILAVPVGREAALVIQHRGGFFSSRQPFGDGPIVKSTYDQDHLLVLQRSAAPTAGSAAFSLTELNLSGDTVWSRSYSYTAVRIPTEQIEAAIDEQAKAFGRLLGPLTPAAVGEWRAVVREALYMPATYTPVSDLLAGRDGTIWLALNPPGTEATKWIVLQPNGQPDQVVLVPRSLRVMVTQRNKLWGIEKDSLDVEYITRYRTCEAAEHGCESC